MLSLSVVDDDQMLLDGFAAWLADFPGLRLVCTAHTVDDLLSEESEPADVVLLDLLLADRSDPAENVRRLVRAGRRVLVVSVVPHLDQAVAVIRAGAQGYLTKDSDLPTLADAVRTVADGGLAHSQELALAWTRDNGPDRPELSERERALLSAYGSGMTLATAARRTGISPEAARDCLTGIRDRYRRCTT
ncbi:DNA-binding NarL/FixJ family response regulator [Crossiella equi]|uniref:DNA-binding NarL/FixJ family response regulator n=1 Tax=Crossiella equi TaxID=130796 RepID=A0ABS5A876_9PSEU|nr:response regulator [Crossiella equi]MBP2472799.1 DNA-binding NarL/FixJ family response regulator [Crossiella equi]